MATLKDIAQLAQVSVSTVSKALNDSGEIRAETRERIIRIAHDLNYEFVPKSADKDGGSRTVGVICPEVSSNYYAQLVDHVSHAISRKDHFFMIGVTEFQPEREEHFLRLFLRKGVDGIIYITENPSPQTTVNRVSNPSHIPIVTIASQSDVKTLDCIRIDDDYGVELAVTHLLQAGHKKIAYIGDNLTLNRHRAFMRLMQSQGLATVPELVCIVQHRFEEGGYHAMREILAKKRPTALIAAYDNMAIGAMRALKEADLRIPEDVAIVGFDNISICPYLHKSLSTISNPLREMASVSVSILAKKMSDPTFRVVQHVLLRPELIARESAPTPVG